MNSTVIQVTYTRTREDQPLVSLQGGPFSDHDYTPAQLRALANALSHIADISELVSAGARSHQRRMEVQV